MKKSIKLVLVVAAIVALPLMAAGMQDTINDKEVLMELHRVLQDLRESSTSESGKGLHQSQPSRTEERSTFL